MRTVTFRRIERERMRRRLLKRNAGIRVHQMLGIMLYLPSLQVEHGKRAFSTSQCRSNGILYPLVITCSRLHLVHHELDEMGLVPVQSRYGGQVTEFSVDAHLSKATLAEIVEQLLVMTFSATHERREKITFPLIVLLHYERNYLLISVAGHFLPRYRRICTRRPRIQKSEEIVNFGYGTDRGTRIVARGLLLDGDNRTQAVDFLNLRLLQHTHKMLGVGGKRIHITPLSLRIYGVESQ